MTRQPIGRHAPTHLPDGSDPLPLPAPTTDLALATCAALLDGYGSSNGTGVQQDVPFAGPGPSQVMITPSTSGVGLNYVLGPPDEISFAPGLYRVTCTLALDAAPTSEFDVVYPYSVGIGSHVVVLNASGIFSIPSPGPNLIAPETYASIPKTSSVSPSAYLVSSEMIVGVPLGETISFHVATLSYDSGLGVGASWFVAVRLGAWIGSGV